MRTISVRFGYLAAVLGIAGLVQVAHAPISAAAPNPDACFTTTGTISLAITGYDATGVGCGTTVEIPSSIGGVTVDSIGNYALYNKALTSIIIPNTVTSIGDNSFYYNQLTTVTIPNSVTSIGSSAFYYNKITTATIPNTVTTIGAGAFGNNQLTTVVIPSSVTSLGANVFAQNQLSSVIIPSSITSISDSAFAANKLTSVTIPNTVTSIGSNAFGRNLLTSVIIPNTVTTIGSLAFQHNQLTTAIFNGPVASLAYDIFQSNVLASITYNGVNYTDNIPLVDACYGFSAGSITSYKLFDMDLIKNSGIACMQRAVTIPSSIGGVPVTSIGGYAFYEKQLTSFVLPSTVTTIGQRAFRSNLLTSINIPNTVVSISYGAFSYNMLSSVTLPNSITTISAFLFTYNRLTSVTLGNAVTKIEYGAFYANNLTSITVPSTLTTIEDWAFVLQSAGDSLKLETDYYSAIPSESKAALDSMWLVKIYTQDPTNPAGLKDKLFYEMLDLDADGNYDNPAYMGGQLINPASATFSFTDPQNGQLQPSQTFTGKLANGTYLTNYFVTQGPVLPTFADPYTLTPQDIQTIQDVFSVYYRVGDTFTYAAPTINGIAPTPASYSFVLGASTGTGINQRQFVYGVSSTSPLTTAVGKLANTGISMWFVVAAASVVVAGSLAVLARR